MGSLFGWLNTGLIYLIKAIGLKAILNELLSVLKNVAINSKNDMEIQGYNIIEGTLIQLGYIDNPTNISGIEEAVTAIVDLSNDLSKLTTNTYDDQAVEFVKGVLTTTGLYKKQANILGLTPPATN